MRYQVVRRGSQSVSQVATFSVEGTGTEWVTFGLTFANGAVASGRTLEVQTTGGVPVSSQGSVLALNDDGSGRHISVTAQVAGGVNYRVVSTPPSGANRSITDLLAAVAGDIASVTLSGGLTGTMTARDLLTSATNRARLNNGTSVLTFEQGSQMLGLVMSQDFNTHLRVTMHLRWYGGTTLWCGFLFENGYLDIAGQGSRSYTATVVLNGVQKLVQSVTHYNSAMWYRSYWSSGGTLYARLSADQLKGLPYYDPASEPTESHLAGLNQSLPVPMDVGDLSTNLGSTGAHDWIGILSRHDARCITSGMDPRAYRSMIRFHHGAMSFSYGSAMDGATGEMLSLSDRPTYSHQNQGVLGSGYSSGRSPQGNAATGSPASHTPSTGFLPYLLTCEWGWLRSMHGWASYMTFWTSQSRNHTYNGETIRQFYYQSTRGAAWNYRSVGHAAWITPDWHYLKQYYLDTINGNFAHDYAEYGPTYSSIGVVEGSEPITQYRSFMHYFLTQACGYLVCELGFESGRTFAQWISTYVAGLLGNTGEYNWCFATAQDHAIAAVDAGPRYTTFTQMDDDTRNVPSYAQSLTPGSQALADAMEANGDIEDNVAGTLTGHAQSTGGYPANARPAVSYFAALGVPGAADCWTRISGGTQPDYRDDPQFNIVPRAA